MSETKIFYPSNSSEWKDWLEKHHASESSVWLVCYSKASQKPSLTWTDAVDIALCYGWIDSKKVKIDQETSHQFFSKRKARSTWSKINKEKIERLTEAGLMAKAGLEAVAIAKQNGSWTLLDEVEDLIVPDDFLQALTARPGAMDFFESLSKSVRKMMLTSLVLARRPETRQNRIDEIADLAAKGMKPKQF